MNTTIPKLETPRLIVRGGTHEDALAAAEYMSRNMTYLAPTEPSRPPEFYTQNYWLEVIKNNDFEYTAGSSCRFFIFHKSSPKVVIGTAGLTGILRGPFQACYLGYGLDEKMQGHGYMTEALQNIVGFAFGRPGKGLNLHRIMANHLPSNTQSAAVLKRLNFVCEGLARDYLLIEGRWQDHVLNALTNVNWQAPPLAPS